MGRPKKPDPFDEEKTEQLITLVYQQPALWSKKHKDHKNTSLLSRKWKAIADAIEEESKIHIISLRCELVR